MPGLMSTSGFAPVGPSWTPKSNGSALFRTLNRMGINPESGKFSGLASRQSRIAAGRIAREQSWSARPDITTDKAKDVWWRHNQLIRQQQADDLAEYDALTAAEDRAKRLALDQQASAQARIAQQQNTDATKKALGLRRMQDVEGNWQRMRDEGQARILGATESGEGITGLRRQSAEARRAAFNARARQHISGMPPGDPKADAREAADIGRDVARYGSGRGSSSDLPRGFAMQAPGQQQQISSAEPIINPNRLGRPAATTLMPDGTINDGSQMVLPPGYRFDRKGNVRDATGTLWKDESDTTMADGNNDFDFSV